MSEIKRVVGNGQHEIYCFVNGGEPGWYNVQALSQDGEWLAGHVCSHPSFGPHDMGCLYDCDWKHEAYSERYPNGFTVIWVDDCKHDERVAKAHAKHVAYGKDGSPWQQQRSKELEKKSQPSAKLTFSDGTVDETR